MITASAIKAPVVPAAPAVSGVPAAPAVSGVLAAPVAAVEVAL
jgi:hypothetical protein